MAKTKIAVYTICKNESKFVRKWLESMWCNGHGADKVYVLDTGSTDGTVQLFKKEVKKLGAPKNWLLIERKRYRNFRFDIARNDNLDMIQPNDIFDALVSVDLDEVFIPKFWDDLRRTVSEHPDFSRINYLYAWNHDENGFPGRIFWYNKIHPQMGYRYKGAVHEWSENVAPEKYSYGGEYNLAENTVYLHHYPDQEKSRSQYLPLLIQRVNDMPDDINAYVYLAREYMCNDRKMDALQTALEGCMKCVDNPDHTISFNYENYAWFCQLIAEIYADKGLRDEADYYYIKAIAANPKARDAYLSYAFFKSYRCGDGNSALKILKNMESDAKDRLYTWHELDYDWTWRPLHAAAVALCWIGKYDEAVSVFSKAFELIRSQKDRNEAYALGFYSDVDWLVQYNKRRLAEHEQTV